MRWARGAVHGRHEWGTVCVRIAGNSGPFGSARRSGRARKPLATPRHLVVKSEHSITVAQVNVAYRNDREKPADRPREGLMSKTHDKVKRLVDRAETCRVLAGIVTNQGAAKSYLKLADSYEALAEKQRRLFTLVKIRAELFARTGRSAREVASGRRIVGLPR